MLGFFRKRISATPVEELVPDTYRNMLQTIFTTQINDSRKMFKEEFSAYFAYTILIELENLTDNPLILKDYHTVAELLTSRTLFKFPDDVTLPLAGNMSIITWEDYFEQYIQKYVEEKVNEMLFFETPECPPLIKSFNNGTEISNTETLQLIIDRVVEVMGREYFDSIVNDLKYPIYNLRPQSLFDLGYEKAKKLIVEAQEHVQSLENDFLDLADSITRVNHLYEKVKHNYKKQFNEELPKGRLPLSVYNKKYKLVLLNLKNDNVPVEYIRELAYLDTKYDKEVLPALFNFRYI